MNNTKQIFNECIDVLADRIYVIVVYNIEQQQTPIVVTDRMTMDEIKPIYRENTKYLHLNADKSIYDKFPFPARKIFRHYIAKHNDLKTVVMIS